nr:unnamed protein product [Spirometra erinaceieuropaei]
MMGSSENPKRQTIRAATDRNERTALVAQELAGYKVEIAELSVARFSEQGQVKEVAAGYTFWNGRLRASSLPPETTSWDQDYRTDHCLVISRRRPHLQPRRGQQGQIETAIPPRRRVYAGRESSPTTCQQRPTYGVSCNQSNQVQYSSVVEDGLKGLKIRSHPTKGKCVSEWTIDFDGGEDVELVVHDWKRREAHMNLSPTRSRAVRQVPQYSSSSSCVDTEDLEDFGETETLDSSTSSGYSSVSSETRDQYSRATPATNKSRLSPVLTFSPSDQNLSHGRYFAVIHSSPKPSENLLENW